ncbi:MAG: glycosyltransferase family 2 protein [Acidimicrobiia bacterium]
MSALELTVLMPCLDEAETVGVCVTKAIGWMERHGVEGEVLVADNGSTDGSQALAAAAGARVIDVPAKGYGAALRTGIAAARGRFVIMGDADDSYDFTALEPFLAELRGRADLVIGNRFRGGIEKGAMPFLHRYVGNPVLSFVGRLFFRVPVADFHCGLRGFRRDRILDLDLRSSGMEFASEMVVRAGLNHFDIREVPTVLRPAGRTRPPHLRTWSDGWRHLRFLLLYSPRWLFLVPGLVMLAVGLILTTVLVVGPVELGGVTLDLSALVYAAALTIIGTQSITFALFTKIYAVSKGFLPADDRIDRLGARFRLERGLLLGFLVFLAGLIAAVLSFWRWREQGWGDLDPGEQLRIVIPASLGLVLGWWAVLASFFLSILGMDKKVDLG